MVSRQTKRKQTNAKIEGKGNTKANKTRVGSKTKQTSPHIQSSQRRIDTTDTSKIAYVLDTNVILSAWDAIFKFEEHDVYIVDQVWSELDNNKKGYSDKAFHARKAIRVIDELIAGKTPEELNEGVVLKPPKEIRNGKKHTGKLFLHFSKPELPKSCSANLSYDYPDHRILMSGVNLQEDGKRVVIVSNDANCRVRAVCAGIEAEEYLAETLITSDADEDMHPGYHKFTQKLWNELSRKIDVQIHNGAQRYTLAHPDFAEVCVHEVLFFGPDSKDMMLHVVEKLDATTIVGEVVKGHPNAIKSEMKPKNPEQAAAIHLLMDTRVKAAAIAGPAGCGKTYLAVGIALALYANTFKRVIITRPLIGLDEDIGFLPGTEEEKMEPWMGAIMDNLEAHLEGGESAHGSIDYVLNHMNWQFKSLNYIRGRSLRNTLIICDEAENLTPHKLKALLTRVGEGSKVILLGNVAQIDANLTEITSGLSVFIRAFRKSVNAGMLTLTTGVRSEIATEAELLL